MSKYVGKHEQRPEQNPDILESAADTRRDEITAPFSGRTSTAVLERTAPPLTATSDYEPMKRKTKKQRRFARFLLIYSVSFLFLIAIGLFVFWKYIASYEISRPEHTMDTLLASYSNDDWAAMWKDGLVVSDFEDKDSIFSKLFGSYFRDANYTYRKSSGEYTDDHPAYIVRSGTTDLFRVSLAPKGHEAAGFGFQLWETAAIQPLVPEAATVTITAPPDAAVYLDGRELPPAYITDDHAAYDDLSQDCRFNADAYRVVYTVGGLYDDISVSALDAQGAQLPYKQDGDAAFSFEPMRQSVRVIAPADAVVTLNGAAFSADDAIGTQYPSSLFDGLEKQAATPVSFLIYEADGLLMAPQIKATDAEGRELTGVDAGGVTSFGFADDEAMRSEHMDRITDFVHAYVNFTANMSDKSEEHFATLTHYLLSGTDMYWRLASLINGIHFVSGLTVDYREIKAYDFAVSGENCFVCRLSFSLTLESYAGSRDMDSAYDMVFIKSGGVWLAAAMSAI
jgi:hypothetical protein